MFAYDEVRAASARRQTLLSFGDNFNEAELDQRTDQAAAIALSGLKRPARKRQLIAPWWRKVMLFIATIETARASSSQSVLRRSSVERPRRDSSVSRTVPQASLEALLALPTDEVDLVRHCTLSSADLAVVPRRHRAHNRLGFAVQLCALRHPDRLLHSGENVPQEVLAFVADKLDLPTDALVDSAIRSQIRYAQLNALYTVYGFRTFTRAPIASLMARWLLPPALATISGATLASVLLEGLRRRAVAAPGPTGGERLVAGALSQAERHVERQIDTGLDDRQRIALDTLLEVPAQAVLSPLDWTRQPFFRLGGRDPAHQSRNLRDDNRWSRW